MQARDEVFLRVGDENRRLTFRQRQELLYDKGQASYETRVLKDSHVHQLDMELVQDYAHAVKAPDGLRLLGARGLTDDDSLTIARCVAFRTGAATVSSGGLRSGAALSRPRARSGSAAAAHRGRAL